MRELLEQGFEVAVVKDATAGARHPELGDGYQAAVINFAYMANAVLSTDEVVKAMGVTGPSCSFGSPTIVGCSSHPKEALATVPSGRSSIGQSPPGLYRRRTLKLP